MRLNPRWIVARPADMGLSGQWAARKGQWAVGSGQLRLPRLPLSSLFSLLSSLFFLLSGHFVLVGLVVGWVLLAGCAKSEPPQPEPDASAKTAGVSEARPARPGDGQAVAATAFPVKAVAEFNRGAALMEQYRYSEAAKAFESVLEVAPAWTAARFNLGLAYFNMYGMQDAEKPDAARPDYLKKAKTAFETVLKSEPDHLPARFCLGLYYEYAGDNAQALKCFEKVYQRNPRDPYAGYKYGATLLSLDRTAEGTKVLEDVVALDPGFISGVYRLALQYTRNKQPEQAKPLFKRFQQLKEAELTGGSFTVDKAYGTAGRYVLAVGADNLPLPRAEATQVRRIVFSPQTRPLDTGARSWKWPAR
jgi:tetratricopeptide (TPR) repeat protein